MQVEISEFRAIHKAKIALNGITVVAGENGCGKTTLSRLVYHTLATSIDFEQIVNHRLIYDLRNEIDTIGDILREIDFSMRYQFREWVKSCKVEDIDFSEFEKRLYSYVDLIEEFITNVYKQLDWYRGEQKQNGHFETNAKFERLARILGNLTEVNKLSNLTPETIADSIQKLKSKIALVIQEAKNVIRERDISVYCNIWSEIFNEKCNNDFCLKEFGAPVTDWIAGKLETVHSIKDCVYIDTPMAINDPSTNDIYWRDLIEALRKKNGMASKTIEQLRIINGIISGEVYFNQEVLDEGFKFKRSDGKIFELQECATGIKSFGIIQVLLRNGILDKDTLLIVDEPEAHLHPQWIVEYARLIVLLNKHIGIKFLIASHNPDMVSALKYIAEKEGVDNKLNFYLADKVEGEFVYDYKDLGTNIDEIFASFNIALERINQYGIIENEIL